MQGTSYVMDLENGEWQDGGTSDSSSGDDVLATHEVDFEKIDRLQCRRGAVPRQEVGWGALQVHGWWGAQITRPGSKWVGGRERGQKG
jgi:hypothetical protein